MRGNNQRLRVHFRMNQRLVPHFRWEGKAILREYKEIIPLPLGLSSAMHKTHYLLLISFCCLLFAQQAHAQSMNLNHFMAKSEGASVIVKWELQDEAGVTEFKLYRKIDQSGEYELVETLQANGALTYTFMDDDIFKNESSIITYELHVLHNGQYIKFYTTLSHNPTAIQRTWGSIKSMFK